MINMILDDASDRMQKAIEAYQRDLATVRTGRATPAMLDRVMVNYYGSPTPINQMAGVSVVEGLSLIPIFWTSLMQFLKNLLLIV